MFKEIMSIIELTDDEHKRMMSPKILYNEDFLLRLCMLWFSKQNDFITNSDSDRKICKAFSKMDGARYYTHATLETPFKVRVKGTKDPLAEPSSKVSGVIGHFKIIYGKKNERLVLLENAKQFNVIETTMFSELNKGIKCNKKYNQVARDIGCMIQTVSHLEIDFVEHINFYVVAPEEQLKLESFKNFTYKPNIEETVKNRILQYGEDKQSQFYDLFNHLFQRIDVDCISYEDIIRFIKKNDNDYGSDLESFYVKCLKHHGKK